jgi:hypothetical protein
MKIRVVSSRDEIFTLNPNERVWSGLETLYLLHFRFPSYPSKIVWCQSMLFRRFTLKKQIKRPYG